MRSTSIRVYNALRHQLGCVVALPAAASFHCTTEALAGDHHKLDPAQTPTQQKVQNGNLHAYYGTVLLV